MAAGALGTALGEGIYGLYQKHDALLRGKHG